MFGFSSVNDLDFYLLTILVFMLVSLIAQALVKKLWKTRIGSAFFIAALIIGVVLLLIGSSFEKSIGFLLVLVFIYAFYVLATFKMMKRGKGDQHAN